jgi:regulation of enolase protein 1 (concanavalin A-like superfamily)
MGRWRMRSGKRGGAVGRRQRRFWLGLLLLAALLVSGVTLPGASQLRGALVSDGFAAATLNPHWQVIRPLEVGQAALSGSPDGQRWLVLSVPPGSNHNPWRSLDALRAVQQVSNQDLSVTTGFASIPFARYQMQGVVAAESESTFIRYEVHHDGTELRLFGAVVEAGTPRVVLDHALPNLSHVQLRLERAGDLWTAAWSADGHNWQAQQPFQQRLTVRELGPFVASYDAAGNAPGFTALVDFVARTGEEEWAQAVPAMSESDTVAPVGSEPEVHARPTSARITWSGDEVSTGSVEYGLAGQEPQRSPMTPPGTAHAVTLTNLAPGTEYQYRAITTDPYGNSSATEGTFTTPEQPGQQTLQSSDFDPSDFVEGVTGVPELAAPWQPVTPLGAGSIGPAEADQPGHLALTVPAGLNHHPWKVNDTVRAVQEVADPDLAVETRLTSMPTRPYQLAGLMVGESRVSFLRFDVHHNGDELRLFASVTADQTPVTLVNQPITVTDGVGLRVERVQDDWRLSYSLDGHDWQTVVEFTHRMVVREVGPFAGAYQRDGEPPGFVALFDYVHNLRPELRSPLEISGVEVDTSTNHVLLRWWSNRDTTATVEYGADTSYGSTSDATTEGTLHSVTLTDVTPGTTYHYRIVARTAAGEVVTTEGETFTTAAGNTGPTIDVWYGSEQSVGPPTLGQKWFNLLGTVSDSDGVASLSYRVNGGPPRPLTIGPDQRRLQWEGDFNADIPVDQLRIGENQITLTAIDNGGRSTSRTVTLLRGDQSATLPYQLEWRADQPVSAQALVVDGKWTVSEEGLRIDQTGYDRLVVVGDPNWSEFEVTVPVTVHGFGPAAHTYLSGGPMFGLGLRWQGHEARDNSQPAWGWNDTGGFAWYRFHESGPRFELMGGAEDDPSVHASVLVDFGVTYQLTVRVENRGGVTRYQARMWREDLPEPTYWLLELEDDDGPERGAVVLIAHQIEATFGTVEVRPLPPISP